MRGMTAISSTVAIVGVFLAGSAAADRIPYGKTVELEASNEQLVIHHHHDWSQVGLDDEDGKVSFTLAEPFGVGNDYSWLSARSITGATPLWQVPSPPLTWLGISRDGRHIIGLSKMQRGNITQLVVFARDGRLLARRHVTTACVPRQEREAQIAQQPAERQRAYAEFLAPECLPPGYVVGETVTNFVYWYNENDPAPRVIEDAGKIIAVEVAGQEGKRLHVRFDPRSVRSQQPLDR
jgi:hypothetical protein